METNSIPRGTSAARAKALGEVLTPNNIVAEMLSRIPIETVRSLETTWMEPACGNGNFLAAIMQIKAQSAEEYGRDLFDINMIKAVCSIYGIDIDSRNVIEARDRIISIVKTAYHRVQLELTTEMENNLKFILECNIQHGDTLLGKNPITNQTLMIREWKFRGEQVNCRDFTLESLKVQSVYYGMASETFSGVHFRHIYKELEVTGSQNSDKYASDDYDLL
jgi:hypothetical protein